MSRTITDSGLNAAKLTWGLLWVVTVASCGRAEPEKIEALAPQALTAGSGPLVREAEVLSRTASATGSQVTSETAASGGQYVQLSGTPPVSSWLQFTLTSIPAGPYEIRVLSKTNTNRGIVQASIDGVNQGSTCDQYSTAPAYQVPCSLGTKTLASGNHTIRFTVIGKSSSSTGYMMVIDQIALIPSGWVGTWSAAPQLTESANMPPASLTNSTLRQLVHVSVGGTQVRIRFSNEFGNGPVTIKAAQVAVGKLSSPVDSSINTATAKALLFSGSASVTIAQGTAIWSDLLAFTLAAGSNLAVTAAFGATPTGVTGHPGSRTTSYLRTNSTNLGEASMSTALQTEHWYYLSGVDIQATTSSAVAILGDSITDGRGSTTNGNDRWPDRLAVRLASSTTPNVGVLNQGIGGNSIVSGGLGPTGLNRFDRDILGPSSVQWAIIFEGINDIVGDASAASLTSAYDTMIAKAHAQALLVYGATITPFGGYSSYSDARESVRQAVNSYVRSGKFDGYIDFDAAVSDGATPPKLQAGYDSGDHLHLNPAGYQKLADTVNLALFSPGTCLNPPTAVPVGTDWVNGPVTQINDNGAWTWYSDERAVVDRANGRLVVSSDANAGGVDGTARNGDVDVVIRDLATQTSQRTALKKLNPDDHNNAGLLIRPDGNYHAMYAGHNQDCKSYYRNYVNGVWTAEQSFDWQPLGCDPTVNTKVSYSNPWNLTSSGKMISFVRSIGTSPNVLQSLDQGQTWTYAGRFTATPQVGYVAGYYKYWGNGVDRVDFVGTEAHPRDLDTSLYHGYHKADGKTYNSFGTVIDSALGDSSSPQVTAFTKVFATGSTISGVALDHAWNLDIARYADGTIGILWQARVVGSDPQNPDLRLLYARFDGTSWKLTYLGKAGPKLYSSEQDYTGGGALQPDDPSRIYISTTYDPRTGTSLGKHEIFQGTTCDNGVSWSWMPMTWSSTRDNLRPIVPAWDASHTALLWFRGTYSSAQIYNSEVVGIIPPL